MVLKIIFGIAFVAVAINYFIHPKEPDRNAVLDPEMAELLERNGYKKGGKQHD